MKHMQVLRMLKVRVHVVNRDGSTYSNAFTAFSTPSAIVKYAMRKIRRYDYKARRIVVVVDVED